MIKPIETHYHGYRFRSRLEARWAVLFDTVKEPWEYEAQGFALPSGPYLPDFWMPRAKQWVEIKPNVPNERESAVAQELADASGFPVAVLVGPPPDTWDPPYSDWDTLSCGAYFPP